MDSFRKQLENQSLPEEFIDNLQLPEGTKGDKNDELFTGKEDKMKHMKEYYRGVIHSIIKGQSTITNKAKEIEPLQTQTNSVIQRARFDPNSGLNVYQQWLLRNKDEGIISEEQSPEIDHSGHLPILKVSGISESNAVGSCGIKMETDELSNMADQESFSDNFSQCTEDVTIDMPQNGMSVDSDKSPQQKLLNADAASQDEIIPASGAEASNKCHPCLQTTTPLNIHHGPLSPPESVTNGIPKSNRSLATPMKGIFKVTSEIPESTPEISSQTEKARALFGQSELSTSVFQADFKVTLTPLDFGDSDVEHNDVPANESCLSEEEHSNVPDNGSCLSGIQITNVHTVDMVSKHMPQIGSSRLSQVIEKLQNRQTERMRTHPFMLHQDSLTETHKNISQMLLSNQNSMSLPVSESQAIRINKSIQQNKLYGCQIREVDPFIPEPAQSGCVSALPQSSTLTMQGLQDYTLSNNIIQNSHTTPSILTPSKPDKKNQNLPDLENEDLSELNVKFLNMIKVDQNVSLAEPIVCMWMEPSSSKPCHEKFMNMQRIADHLQTAHIKDTKPNTWICYWQGCDRRDKPFFRKKHIIAHQRLHTGQTPFQCPWIGCRKQYSYFKELKIHMRSHSK